MKLEKSFLRSKVARRIFFLFVACALLPITALSVITYLNMGNQLREQSQRELFQASKSMGMAIFERLLLIEVEMRMISSNLNEFSTDIPPFSDPKNVSSLRKHFKGLSLFSGTGEIQNLFGNIDGISAIESKIKQKTLTDDTMVLTEYFSENQTRVFAAFLINPEDSRTGVLIAEIIPSYLWFFGFDDPLPNGVELSIMDQAKNVLFASHPEGDKLSDFIKNQAQTKTMGLFDWASHEGKYIASFRSIFLMSQFNSPDWIIIVSKSKSTVFAPLSNFKLTFPPVILITFWIVLLLSSSQIRRSMGPLAKLKEGTKRIVERDFESRIEVNSRDEFGDVAASFNSMASQIGRQIKTLTAMVDIDQACLIAKDEEKILTTVLEQLKGVFGCLAVGIAQLNTDSSQWFLTFIRDDNPSLEKHTEIIEVSETEMEMLRGNPVLHLTGEGLRMPTYISPMTTEKALYYLVLPLSRNNQIKGMIILGYEENPELNQEDASHARHLADQVAVALSNAQLIEELNNFNLGTLRALARTIDTKSKWTAGHSEKVTHISLQIGAAMGLSTDALNLLHRGGLLHDIGKLGISHEILDKRGALSDEEREMMNQHVLLGVNILQPITAYKEIIPIVKEHHENYDGSGYVSGLSGENINLYARIVAVADRYEAITADRPYRKSLDQESAIRIIQEQTGKHFDPKVVRAFLKMLQWNKKREDPIALRKEYESRSSRT